MKLTKESRINSEFLDEEIHGKMPVFCCSCGVKILIVPDLLEMKKAIENHIVEHKKLSGQILTEDNLTQRVLEVVIDAINEI
jgi:hypothetical protein